MEELGNYLIAYTQGGRDFTFSRLHEYSTLFSKVPSVQMHNTDLEKFSAPLPLQLSCNFRFIKPLYVLLTERKLCSV